MKKTMNRVLAALLSVALLCTLLTGFVAFAEEEASVKLGYINTSADGTLLVGGPEGERHPMSTAAGNWLTDLANRATGSQVSFRNNGSIRANLTVPEGGVRDVTAADIYAMLPEGQRLYVYDITYAELLDVLNYATNKGYGSDLRMSGIDCYYATSVSALVLQNGQCIYKYGAWETGYANKTVRVSVSETVATNANAPFSKWNSTSKLVSSDMIDNESFIRVLKQEGKDGTGLLRLDTQPHLIADYYLGDIHRYYAVFTSSNQGGKVTPTQTVLAGETVKVTITPNEGYDVKNVIVDGVSKGRIFGMTFESIQNDHTVSVEFAKKDKKSYTITTSANAGGTVTPTQTVSGGMDVVITITPDNGYKIQNVVVDGVSKGSIKEVRFSSLNANHTVAVTFQKREAVSPDTYYTVTTSASEGGTITATQRVKAGAEVMIVMTANPGYQLVDVVVDGVSEGVMSKLVFNGVYENHTVKAVFARREDRYYTIEFSVEGGGSAPTTQRVKAGSDVRFDFTPDKGNAIVDVIVDGASRGPQSYIKFQNVNRNHTIRVIFTKKATDPCAQFTDVSNNKWYHAAVDYVITHKLFWGTSDTTFAPEKAMTRGMLVTVLYRMENSPTVYYKDTFQDVGLKSWYTPAVIWAADHGIVQGMGNGYFRPDQKVTREQIAVILFNYTAWKQRSTEKRADLKDYPDGVQVSAWAREAMSWANAEGLIQGRVNYGVTRLVPQGDALRAEVANILMRYLEGIAK